MKTLRPPSCHQGFRSLILGACFLSMVCLNLYAGEDPEGAAMLQAARKQVAAWNQGAKPSAAVLRVVYFVPADIEPLRDHAARLDRVMKDVRRFYQDGFRRFGLDADVLPLEEMDGKLVLHEVKGKLPASKYHHESGDQTKAEIVAALKGTIDFQREHVLVLYALCRKEPDGRYVFDAPYYGDLASDQRSGFCHAADCELLDPELLIEKEKPIVYTEHYYPRMEQTVAAFNSMYIGGIAHEMGHGIGLRHDAGNPVEDGFGESLMGGGNLTYRQEVWGGGPGSYLARATALQLVSHPLFTRTDHGRWDDARGYFKSLVFEDCDKVLKIHGKAAGRIPPYGVIFRVWPASAQSDHGAVSFPVVLEDGSFHLEIPAEKPGENHLTLTLLHANGGTSSEFFQWKSDKDGHSNLTGLNSEWRVDRAEAAVVLGDPQAREFVADDAVAAVTDPEAKLKLRVLRGLLDPVEPVKLDAVKGNEVFLSDVEWRDAGVGRGELRRNSNWFDARNPASAFLTVAGRVREKGLYAHAPARHVFDPDGKWKTLEAVVGLQQGAGPQASAVFVVKGDGRELYRSKILRDGSCDVIHADITGVKQLELTTEGGEADNHRSPAVWADPKITR